MPHHLFLWKRGQVSIGDYKHMTDKFHIGFKEAESEFKERLTKEIKRQTLLTLEALEKARVEKSKVEEKIRILKMDLDDLKLGKLDKIKERQQKSKVACQVSLLDVSRLLSPGSITVNGGLSLSSGSSLETFYGDSISGVYNTSARTYYL